MRESFQIGYLLPEPVTEVWADPYLAGVPRSEGRSWVAGFSIRMGQRDTGKQRSDSWSRPARSTVDLELSGTDPSLGCDTGLSAVSSTGTATSTLQELWYRLILSP